VDVSEWAGGGLNGQEWPWLTGAKGGGGGGQECVGRRVDLGGGGGGGGGGVMATPGAGISGRAYVESLQEEAAVLRTETARKDAEIGMLRRKFSRLSGLALDL